jgi:hypothetical protein
VWRARLSWRSPPRLRRCRVVSPLEAGSGATPASRAKAASERTRSLCDQLTEQLCGDDRSDARLVEERRGECADVTEDLALEERCLVGGRLDALGEGAERDDGGEMVGGASVRAAEATAAPDQLGDRKHPEVLSDDLRRSNDHAAELDERDSSHVDCASPGDHQHAQRFLPLARSGSGTSAGPDDRARRTDRVEWVVLAVQPPLSTRATGALVQHLAARGQVSGEPGAIVTGALNRPQPSSGANSSANRGAAE